MSEPKLFEEGQKYKFTGTELVKLVEGARAVAPQQCITMLTSYVAAVQPVIRPWIPIEQHKPAEGQIVLVSGGTAQYREGVFYTGMESPHYQRPIEWPVRFWMPIPEVPA